MPAVIVEAVRLGVRAGQEAEFERAFAEARPIIAASPGFEGVELRRCVEHTSRYLLLVRWATLADHTIGFRQGPDYPRWRALLHHFYDQAPEVEHYEEIG